MDHLCRHPQDARGAFVCIPQHERRLYLEAFQSFLWNRVLAKSIHALFEPADLIDVLIARTKVPFYGVVPSTIFREGLGRPLPLPSARDRSQLGPLTGLYEEIAGEFGLECRTIRVKYPRDSFFSRGSRPAVFSPQSASATAKEDEEHAARSKLLLRFDLPPGCYATVLVKRLVEVR